MKQLLLLLSFSIFSIHGFTQDSLHVMFLGNSYTYVNDLPQLVHDVAASAGDSLYFDSYTPGGYTLDQHSADPVSNALIEQGGWDYVVLQEQSQLPALQEYEFAGPENLSRVTAMFNPCARVMFYMTWGRKNGDASNCVSWPPVCTYNGMDSMLQLRYLERAALNRAEVSPVGKVWHRIRDLYPLIELYQPDESHPSEAGTYAAACSFYASLFKSDPTNITFDFTLPAADASAIRQVVKEIVYDSLSLYDFTEFNPVSLFHYSATDTMNSILFSNTCSNAESYLWDFGDGDTSTITNPVHTFPGNGIYTVTLTAYDCDIYQMHDSSFQLQVSFCQHTPVISPAIATWCPNNMDTFRTQTYDAYQWLNENADTLAGEINQYFVGTNTGLYSVIATLNGCSELSVPAYADSYLHNIVNYNLDTTQLTDSACMGDTLRFIIYPMRPPPPFYQNHWYQNGNLLNYQGDTLLILSSGTYNVHVENLMCPGYNVFESDTQNIVFYNCNNPVVETFNPGFEIYPVPAKENLFLRNNKTIRYEIFDIFSRKLFDGHATDRIDISNLKPGIYFINIAGSKRKFIRE